jgi:hypothetical protein
VFINFTFYSFELQSELFVEAEINYKEPNPNNTVSDWDYYGGYNILSIDVYEESGELLHVSNVSSHKQQQLDNEIRDKLNQQIRCLEIDDSRFYYLDIDDEFEREYYNTD